MLGGKSIKTQSGCKGGCDQDRQEFAHKFLLEIETAKTPDCVTEINLPVAVVDHCFLVMDDLETQLESIKEHIFDKGVVLSNIVQLYELKHAVTPLMEATGKLHGGRVPPACANTMIISAMCTSTSPALTPAWEPCARPSAPLSWCASPP